MSIKLELPHTQRIFSLYTYVNKIRVTLTSHTKKSERGYFIPFLHSSSVPSTNTKIFNILSTYYKCIFWYVCISIEESVSKM